jgi:hypothetical protein
MLAGAAESSDASADLRAAQPLGEATLTTYHEQPRAAVSIQTRQRILGLALEGRSQMNFSRDLLLAAATGGTSRLAAELVDIVTLELN